MQVPRPRDWHSGTGCISTVWAIPTQYFREQMVEFRSYMCESDATLAERDRAWLSLCMQYESLMSNPTTNGVESQFNALMGEWEFRRNVDLKIEAGYWPNPNELSAMLAAATLHVRY
jgi:hypothetical protein